MTTHFLHKLRDIKNVPEQSFMVTMDVHGLYNNIDHEEGANARFKALQKGKKNVSSETLRTIILFILKNNVFRFWN